MILCLSLKLKLFPLGHGDSVRRTLYLTDWGFISTQNFMTAVNAKTKRNVLSPSGSRQPRGCHSVADRLWWDIGSEAQVEDGYEPKLPAVCTTAVWAGLRMASLSWFSGQCLSLMGKNQLKEQWMVLLTVMGLISGQRWQLSVSREEKIASLHLKVGILHCYSTWYGER